MVNRILIITWDTGRTGTARVVENLTCSFAVLGKEVMVLDLKQRGMRAPAMEKAGATVISLNGDFAQIEKLTRDFKPDIVNYHRPGLADPPTARIVEKLRLSVSCPLVETNHFGRIDYSLEGNLFNYHVMLSGFCRQRWLHWAPPGRRRKLAHQSGVIPHPVNIPKVTDKLQERVINIRRSLGVSQDSLILGRVGSPSFPKWHPLIWSMFEEVMKIYPQTHLLLVGCPEDLKRAGGKMMARFPHQIHLRPPIDYQEELDAVYRCMDIFVHAALIGESFGMVLAEAMNCGIPVVTLATPHKDNSQEEVVSHLHTGLVAGNPKAFLECVLRLMSDRDLRLTLGAHGPSYVQENFDSIKVATQYLNLFESLHSQSPLPSFSGWNSNAHSKISDNYPLKYVMLDKFVHNWLLYRLYSRLFLNY